LRRFGQATDDNTVHTHCMLELKSTNTHPEYVIIKFFHCDNGNTNAPQYTLPDLFNVTAVVTFNQ